MYLPLKFAKQNEDSGLIEIMKMAGLNDEIQELTGDNCLDLCTNPAFYTPAYEGPLEKLNNLLIMNKQISSTFFGDKDPRSEWKDVISMHGVVAKWSESKQVYKFDRDFAMELSKTDGLKLYPEVLRHLPFDTFYLDFDGMEEFKPFDGMFVSVKVFDNDDLRICGHRVIGDIYYTCTVCLNEGQRDYENGVAYYDYTRDRMRFQKDVPLSHYLQEKLGNKMLSNKSFPDIWMFLIQAITYLSSDKPEVEESELTKKTYRKASRIRNKFSEVREWHVGVRYGNKFRKARAAREAEEQEGSIIARKSPRPHARCAHWQRFWTGHGKNIPKIKWVSQTFVGTRNKAPVVIRKVENS